MEDDKIEVVKNESNEDTSKVDKPEATEPIAEEQITLDDDKTIKGFEDYLNSIPNPEEEDYRLIDSQVQHTEVDVKPQNEDETEFESFLMM
jgi:hypothetical protein